MRKEAPASMPDGTPLYVIAAERYLVGGVMLTELPSGLPVTAQDFHDQTLGVIWTAITRCDVPMVTTVCAELHRMGWLDRVGAEPRLVELTGIAWEWLASVTEPGIREHARMVHEWGEKRRQLQSLGKQAQAIYEGRTKRRGGVHIDP